MHFINGAQLIESIMVMIYALTDYFGFNPAKKLICSLLGWGGFYPGFV